MPLLAQKLPWEPYAASWLIAIPSLAVFLFMTSVVYNLFLSPLRSYPGPRLWKVSQVPLSLAWMSGAGHKRILELHQQYGDVVRISPNQLSFSYPEAWNDIMGHRKRGQSEHGKDPDFWMGDDKLTLVGSDLERHSRLRKILSHGFSAQAMMEQQPTFQRYTSLLIDRLKKASAGGSEAVEMTKWFNWATFDMAGDLIFGEPFGCLEKAEWHPWVKLIFMHLKGIAISTAIIRFPFSDTIIKMATPKKVAKDIEAHHEFVEALVAKRLAFDHPRADFMESMIKARDKNQISHREILANAHNLIVGGSETTATTLAGACYLLAMNKPVMDKLYQELTSTFVSEEEINLLSVQKLDYMFAVLHETLRIYPAVVAAIPRRAPPEGSTIGGMYIPPNTILAVWQWPLFHNPKFFKDPESFVPERFLGDPKFDGDQKAAVQPFAVGPRNCIGKNLAYAEMRLILAKLIWHFDIGLDPRSEGWMDRNAGYLLWEKPELLMRLVPRESQEISDIAQTPELNK